MRTKEKARELYEKFFQLVDCGDNRYSTKTQFENSKKCALISIENEYNSLREQLFNLRSCHVIESETVYLKRLNDLSEEEKQIKIEIEKL